MWVSFWVLYSVPLISQSILSSILDYLDFCNFISSLEVGWYRSSDFVLLQYCVGSRPLPLHVYFNIYVCMYVCIYLFIWLHWALVAARGIFTVACGLFVCSARASLVAARGLQSVGSVVVAHGLRCPEACGILVPQPGIERMSPALEGRFSTTGSPGKSLYTLQAQFVDICKVTYRNFDVNCTEYVRSSLERPTY